MNEGAALAATAATAGPFLVAKLRALDARLDGIVPRVLATPPDDSAVHDLRVVLRRIRTVLEVGRSVLGPFHADEVRRALRDVHQATGELRDEEVLLSMLGELGVDLPDVNAWLDGRRLREERLRRALVHLVQSGALDDGRRLLDALLAFRVRPSRDRRLAKVARRSVDEARRGVDRRRAAQPDDVEGLHRLRIAYKRLRYTAETFADALPADLAALAPTAARFQRWLGDLHDVHVAIASVRRARKLTDESRAELLAILERLRVERVAAYAKEVGIALVPTLPQAEGTASLRKISSR